MLQMTIRRSVYTLTIVLRVFSDILTSVSVSISPYLIERSGLVLTLREL